MSNGIKITESETFLVLHNSYDLTPVSRLIYRELRTRGAEGVRAMH